MKKITRDQAAICADFMLDEDPAQMWLPYDVAQALAHYDDRKSMYSLMALQMALQVWYDRDEQAVMGLLGPGLHDDTE